MRRKQGRIYCPPLPWNEEGSQPEQSSVKTSRLTRPLSRRQDQRAPRLSRGAGGGGSPHPLPPPGPPSPPPRCVSRGGGDPPPPSSSTPPPPIRQSSSTNRFHTGNSEKESPLSTATGDPPLPSTRDLSPPPLPPPSPRPPGGPTSSSEVCKPYSVATSSCLHGKAMATPLDSPGNGVSCPPRLEFEIESRRWGRRRVSGCG